MVFKPRSCYSVGSDPTPSGTIAARNVRWGAVHGTQFLRHLRSGFGKSQCRAPLSALKPEQGNAVQGVRNQVKVVRLDGSHPCHPEIGELQRDFSEQAARVALKQQNAAFGDIFHLICYI